MLCLSAKLEQQQSQSQKCELLALSIFALGVVLAFWVLVANLLHCVSTEDGAALQYNSFFQGFDVHQVAHLQPWHATPGSAGTLLCLKDHADRPFPMARVIMMATLVTMMSMQMAQPYTGDTCSKVLCSKPSRMLQECGGNCASCQWLADTLLQAASSPARL